MKILKIIGIIVIALVAIIYTTSDYIIERQLKSELSKLINTDSISYYDFSVSKLDLSIVSGSVTIRDVKITPSQAALNSLRTDNNDVRVLVKFSCNTIEMRDFEIRHFLKTQEIVLDKFIIIEPDLSYLFNKNKSSNTNTLALNNVFSNSFKKASIQQFVIDDATISVKNIENKSATIQFENFDFVLTNAVIDTVTIKRFSPFDYDNIEFSADQLHLNIHHDFSLSTERLTFNAEKNTTTLENFKLKPTYTQENFSKKYPVQKQWVAVTLDTFKISNINFEKLIQHGEFEISKVDIIKANVGLYKDKSKPEPPFNKQLLPVSALKLLPIKLSLDTIMVSNSRIVINEKSDLSGQVSNLSFDNLNATITGFSNDSAHVSKHKFLTVNAQTKIMNSADVSFKAEFDLRSIVDKHYVRATIGPTDISVFNPTLEPMMLVVARSGKINSINYSYTGNDTEAIGTIDFEYENIKIDVLNAEMQTKKQGFMSLAANTVLKSNNKKTNENTYTQGVIKATRVQNKNVFPYLWHAVQSGIIYTIAPAFSEVKKEEKQERKNKRKKKKNK